MARAGLLLIALMAAVLALFPVAVAAAFPASDQSVIEASPASLTFADGSAATQSVTIKSRGSKPAQLGSPVVEGSFSIRSSSCNPGPFFPLATCTVTVAATRGGPTSGSLVLTDTNQNAVTRSLRVPLAILGPTPPPTPSGSIFLNPASAPPATRVTFSGAGLDASAILAVLFDSNHVADVSTDGSGNFSIQLAIPDNATGASHQVCVSESNGNLCSGFTLEAAGSSSTPTDTASPSPSPGPSGSPSPLAVGSTSGGGSSPLALLIKPPFVFLPIIAALALLAFLGLYLWRARPTPAIGDVTILHRAPEPRLYETQPEAPPPPVPAPPPVVYESPSGPASAPPPAPKPAPPSGADIPPDLPEASD